MASVVVTPSARERFTPRELTDAYEQFKERGPQYVSAESGLRAAARAEAASVVVFAAEVRDQVAAAQRRDDSST